MKKISKKYTTELRKNTNRIRNGDILYSWSGNPQTSLEVSKWFGGGSWLNQHIYKICLHKSQNPFFIYYLLKEIKPTLVRLAEGKQTTGLGHVTVADMKELYVAYPSHDVLNSFDELVSVFYKYDSIIRKELIKLLSIQTTILNKMSN